jgi:nucleoside 2-deoxyribosyltransferase
MSIFRFTPIEILLARNLKRPYAPPFKRRQGKISMSRLYFKVYLAGPIAQFTYDDAEDWREKTHERMFLLSGKHIMGYSPLRGKEDLLPTGEILTSKPYDYHPMTTSRGIMARDHNDVKTADLMLVNLLGAKHISVGTVMEMAFAYAYRVPTILVIEPEGNPHDNHAMLQQTYDYRFVNLNDACDAAVHFLLP